MEISDEAAAKAGFAIGFVGPHAAVGRDDVTVYVDHDAAAAQFWAGGANEVDYHVKHFNWKRDLLDPLGPAGADRVKVAELRNAAEGDPSPLNDGGVLAASRGIEIGHIFKLGTKYSEAMDATFLDEQGKENPCIMGCYGIGINRILASAIEAGHDADGCVLPASIAPFEVEIIQLNNDKPDVCNAAERIYNELRASSADVLLDDRDARPGVKFKDADLIGIPLRVVVGERSLKDGYVEIKRRTDKKPMSIPVSDAVSRTLEILTELKETLSPDV